MTIALDGLRSDVRDLCIIHAAERYVVIDKPAGLLSVPGKGPEKQDCAVARVRERFPHATGPMVVHRLDMDTSGLLIVALDAPAQRELSMRFAAREVEKRYVALLDGIVEADSGEVRLPLRPDVENRPVQIVDFVHGNEAITRWKVLSREVDRTRVEMTPLTGKTHQLRVHAAVPRDAIVMPDGSRTGGIGHAIVGDVLYGPDAASNGADLPVQRDGHPPRESRLMLHAAHLALATPGEGWMEFRSGAEF